MFIIENCTIGSCGMDGIHLAGSAAEHTHILNTSVSGCGRHAIYAETDASARDRYEVLRKLPQAKVDEIVADHSEGERSLVRRMFDLVRTEDSRAAFFKKVQESSPHRAAQLMQLLDRLLSS